MWIEGLVCGTGPGRCGDERVQDGCTQGLGPGPVQVRWTTIESID